jgi:hypothetical protein
MVGSVADYGSSENDLDILVYTRNPTRAAEVVAVVNAIRERCPELKCTGLDDDMFNFVNAADRPIEVWLGNVPKEIWQSHEFLRSFTFDLTETARKMLAEFGLSSLEGWK